MKTFLMLITLSNIAMSCSVTSDFEFATIEEQINYAGVIFQGTVVSASDPYNQAVVVLKDLQFYRGCFTDEVISVEGFRGDSLCGAGIPKIGDKIIVFACENTSSNSPLKVNQFEPFTGWARGQDDYLQKVKQLTYNETAQCNPVRKAEKCLNRKSAGWKSQRKPNILIEPEPVLIEEPQTKVGEPIYIEYEEYLPPKKYLKPIPVQFNRNNYRISPQNYGNRNQNSPLY